MFNFYLERNTELHEQILLCLGIAMNLFIVALSNPFWPQTLICAVDFPRMSGWLGSTNTGWHINVHHVKICTKRSVKLNIMEIWGWGSLVPRPSHRPVFDRLQYAKMEGERSGIIYHVNDVSVYRGGEGSLIERTLFADAFFILNQERYAFRFANLWNSSAWGRNYKIRPLARSIDGGPPLPLST